MKVIGNKIRCTEMVCSFGLMEGNFKASMQQTANTVTESFFGRTVGGTKANGGTENSMVKARIEQALELKNLENGRMDDVSDGSVKRVTTSTRSECPIFF